MGLSHALVLFPFSGVLAGGVILASISEFRLNLEHEGWRYSWVGLVALVGSALLPLPSALAGALGGIVVGSLLTHTTLSRLPIRVFGFLVLMVGLHWGWWVLTKIGEPGELGAGLGLGVLVEIWLEGVRRWSLHLDGLRLWMTWRGVGLSMLGTGIMNGANALLMVKGVSAHNWGWGLGGLEILGILGITYGFKKMTRDAGDVDLQYWTGLAWDNHDNLSEGILRIAQIWGRGWGADECHIWLLDKNGLPNAIDYAWRQALGSQEEAIAEGGNRWRVHQQLSQDNSPALHTLYPNLPDWTNRWNWKEIISLPIRTEDMHLGRVVLARINWDQMPWGRMDVVRLQKLVDLLGAHLGGLVTANSLEAIAYTDGLTGAYNELWLMERLAQQKHRSVNDGLLYLDLNKFKSINDQRGHELGDRAIQVTAERLKAVIKRQDHVVRLHGDEFVVWVHDLANINHLRAIAQRISEVLRQPTGMPKPAHSLEASIGGVWGLPPEVPPESILRKADSMMYRAKRSGDSPMLVDGHRLGFE